VINIVPVFAGALSMVKPLYPDLRVVLEHSKRQNVPGVDSQYVSISRNRLPSADHPGANPALPPQTLMVAWPAFLVKARNK
jgi:hypothetical protein